MGGELSLAKPVEVGDLDRVKAILSNPKANVQEINPVNGDTLLHIAAKGGNVNAKANYEKIAELLLKYGLDVNAQNNLGFTPTHSAAMRGQASMISFLIDRGADINAKHEIEFWTPLHCASQNGHLAAVEVLLSRGADITVRTNHNETPLHLAAAMGRFEVTKYLCETHNADLFAQNSDGDTPFDSAKAKSEGTVEVYLFFRMKEALEARKKADEEAAATEAARKKSEDEAAAAVAKKKAEEEEQRRQAGSGAGRAKFSTPLAKPVAPFAKPVASLTKDEPPAFSTSASKSAFHDSRRMFERSAAST